jgi:hypothetical protein
MQKYFSNIQAYEYIRILRNGAGMTNSDWLEEIHAIYPNAMHDVFFKVVHSLGLPYVLIRR